MTLDEMAELVREMERQHARYTLEDVVREEGVWVAYLYEARARLTFRVADYRAYHAESCYLPASWIVHSPRRARGGAGDGDRAEATITLAELGQIVADAGARGWQRLRALHIRYGDWDEDDRYWVRVEWDDDPHRPRAVGSLAAYHALR